jgi:protein gp37
VKKSKIEWTDTTWNPIVGCAHISEGCENCYAARHAWRMGHNPKTRGVYVDLAHKTSAGRLRWTNQVRLVRDRLEQPLRWRRPRRVFVCSMADWCHPSVPHSFRSTLLALAMITARHTYQFLTKRSDTLLETFGYINRSSSLGLYQHGVQKERAQLYADSYEWGLRLNGWLDGPWPLPNVWLGATVESSRHLGRIDRLRQCPAAVRFLSCEPLLSSLGTLDLTGIDWVIVGGESGPGARPMHPGWVREVRDQCQARGVAFFFKQWGEWSADRELIGERTRTRWSRPAGLPAWPRMYRVGKRLAGRHLDGCIWDEMPERTAT